MPKSKLLGNGGVKSCTQAVWLEDLFSATTGHSLQCIARAAPSEPSLSTPYYVSAIMFLITLQRGIIGPRRTLKLGEVENIHTWWETPGSQTPEPLLFQPQTWGTISQYNVATIDMADVGGYRAPRK